MENNVFYVTKHQKKLRCGITTGTCAAAAAKAAAELLLLGRHKESVLVHTPKGVDVQVPVFLSSQEEKKAEYWVVKDSGDDPDVTNHAKIFASVEKLGEGSHCPRGAFSSLKFPGIFLDGGFGVGRVTREGMEQEKGQAAINAVPREMVFKAVHEVCREAGYGGALLAMICVPEGKELAKRTFNPRLGIEGGISILGTSGMIEPMSEKAIIDTIELQIRQLQAQGEKKLLVTPGNYGQGYASSFLHLDLDKSVKCSNYIGETLDIAVACGMQDFLLVGNIGKLVKLAAGIMNTHSKVADGRREILAVHTVLSSGDAKLVPEIMKCINTEEILQLLDKNGIQQQVVKSLCGKIEEYVSYRVGDKMAAGVILFSEKFGYLGRTKKADGVLKLFGGGI
ncbi:cobalamin biosynthesis protein CbiD [bacterium D16-51]|nr:cobalamin biosynthesis protein CbiD [bacterium D16-59]RKI58904.1 cobalamin biosynthesis protein CbiD [bacterium D16-51]